MFAFVVLGLVSSVPSQEIRWEKRLKKCQVEHKNLTYSLNHSCLLLILMAIFA